MSNDNYEQELELESNNNEPDEVEDGGEDDGGEDDGGEDEEDNI